MVEPAEQFEILVQTNDIENEETGSSISGIKKVAYRRKKYKQKV